MGRRPARFTEADLRRAIRAIDQAGADMVVEILPDGTMRVGRLIQDTVAPQAKDSDRTVVL